MEFYQLIQTKIEFHPFTRKEHHPLTQGISHSVVIQWLSYQNEQFKYVLIRMTTERPQNELVSAQKTCLGGIAKQADGLLRMQNGLQ